MAAPTRLSRTSLHPCQRGAVHTWAIGRSNARFQSYGYTVGPQVLVLAWPQLVRLRYEIGLGEDVFAMVTTRAVEETAAAATRTPMPYILDHRGVRVVFKDIWSSYDDGAPVPEGEAC